MKRAGAAATLLDVPPALLAPKARLELPSRGLVIRAAFMPETFRQEDAEGNPTIELVASAGAAVRRFGYFDGGFEEFDELLSFEEGAHRNERLDSGRTPLLLDHNRYSVRNVVGVLAEPRWDRKAKTLTMTARLSRAPEFASVIQNLRDGIVRNTSIGYETHLARDVTEKGDAVRQILAVDWEIHEVSLVTVGADPDSYVRTNAPDRTTVVVLSRELPMEPDEIETTETPAPATTPTRTTTETPAPAPAAPAARQAPAPAADAQAAVQAENARQREIRVRLREARLPLEGDFARGLLDDPAVTADGASTRILRHLAAQGETPEGSVDGTVRVGQEGGSALARQLENALLARLGWERCIEGATNERGQVERARLRTVLQGNPFLHRSLMEAGEHFLRHAFGVRGLEAHGKRERAGLILRPRISAEARHIGAGMHTTSDFPGILANVVNKILLMAYELAPDTYSQWTTRGSLADYKQAQRLQLGHSPRLLSVPEGAEYQYATVGEQNEPIILGKFGRIIGLSREAMVNDDLDAFGRLSRQAGASARQLIADLVYAHVTGNTVMADGQALFSVAHKNLVTGGGNSLASAGVTALSNLRTKARLQTTIPDGLAGGDTPFFQAVAIEHLRVPVELETAAQQLTTAIQAQQVGNVNPFQGSFRSVMAEPRLSAASTAAFYGFADPSMTDSIEVAFLQGEEGPQVESRMGFEIDGVEVKVRMDVATAPIEFRGAYKNEGTT